MSKKKDTEWLQGDEKEFSYHLQQYENPKAYTKVILEKLKEWKLDSPGTKIADLACGAGAPTYFLAKNIPQVSFYGVDLNKQYIEFANKHKLPNTSFKTGDIVNNKKDIPHSDGILCLQTFSWIKDYKKPLKNIFKAVPKWILITSLFYEGPVDTEIIIKDYSRTMGKFKYRESYYNIYSLEKLNSFVEKQGYNLSRAEPFIFPFDLDRPKEKGMATYTEKLMTGDRIQISGPLMMPWYTVLITKNN